jgi:hypothetical protein
MMFISRCAELISGICGHIGNRAIQVFGFDVHFSCSRIFHRTTGPISAEPGYENLLKFRYQK